MGDQFPLSSLDVTWTFLSFQCMLAVEGKQRLCMELALGCSDSLAGPRELAAGGVWATAGSSNCAVAAADFPGLNDVLLQSILRSISLHQPGTSELGGDYSLRVGQFIGGQCSFSGENHYNVKLQTSEGKKTSRDWLQSSSGSLCTGVNVFSSDHSSERTKGLMRDRGRMDPRTE